jgi:hypothetical protein
MRDRVEGRLDVPKRGKAELNKSDLPLCTFVELALPELIDALMPEGSWHWREDKSSWRILTTSINNHCQRVLLDNYCRRGANTESEKKSSPEVG